jgi:hypothetical protein
MRAVPAAWTIGCDRYQNMAGCADGQWEEQFWSQRQRQKMQISGTGYESAAEYQCTTLTIDIPASENWIIQGGYTSEGELAPLDARLSSGSRWNASSAGVVLRYLSVSGKSDQHSGGAFDYRGGDGAAIVFEHVHFLHNAATFAGAVNIGLVNGETPHYDPLAVDGGLQVSISGCLFQGNTAFKCE